MFCIFIAMKCALLCFALVLFCHGKALGQTIRWDKNRTLTYGDFKRPVVEKPNVSGEVTETEYLTDYGSSAASKVSVFYDIRVLYRSDVLYHISAEFNPYESHFLPKGDTMILKHEQGHFDIAELYARKMRHFVIANATSEHDEEFFQKALDSINESKSGFEAHYDRESTVEYWTQIRWWQAIQKGLDSLRDFTATDGRIKLK